MRMEPRSHQSAVHSLYEIANSQGGYVTAKQAIEAGFPRQHMAYHVSVGNLERVDRGLFRLPTVPVSEHDELIRWTLWSRGRDDRPRAVVSHASALRVHDLSDILPVAVHLTVPPGFRKRPPHGCVLHLAILERSEMTAGAGFRVTTPLRTLIDAAVSPDVPTEQLRLAMHEAVERGLIAKAALRAALRRAAAEADASSRLADAAEGVL